MSCISLRAVEANDIPIWLNLSREFDSYINELVEDLSQWYNGNEQDISFLNFMNAKIAKKEAIMAIKNNDKSCLGIIAFSRTYNRITFFAISHKADFELAAKQLIDFAMSQLDIDKIITVNIIKSNAEIFCKERKIFSDYGFVFGNSELENGVPVDKFFRLL